MSNFFRAPSAAATPPSSVGNATVKMPKLAAFLGSIVNACLHLTIFLVPLFFATATMDVLELNKQTLLTLLVVVMVIAWLGKALAEKRFSLTRSWLHLVVVLFGLGYLALALLSQDRYLSFVGQLGQQAWSFTTVAALVLLYIVVVNHVRSITQVYNLALTFLLSSTVAAFFGIAQLFGVFLLPIAIIKNPAFNSVGSVFSLAVFLTAPLVMAASLAFHGCRDRVCMLGTEGMGGNIARAIVWLSLLSALAFLLVVDFWPAWAALLFGMVLVVGIGFLRTREVKHPARLGVPAVIMVVAVVFLVIKSPITATLPGEVSPSMQASWLIAQQTLQDHPVFGSGPNTWIYDYAKYRVQLINLSPFWSIRFDRGFSSFLTLLATIGLSGTGLLIILMLSAIGKSVSHLLHERQDDLWHAYLMVFCGWATMGFVLFVYNFGMTHQMVFWVLLALLGSLVAQPAWSWEGKQNVKTFGVLSVVFILAAAGAVSVFWITGQRYAAEVLFNRAVTMFRNNQPIEQVLPLLAQARTLNTMSDAYPRNEAQAKLVQVATLMKTTQTADQARQIHDLVSSAVDLAMKARDLSPSNVDNWSNLALIYQSVASFTAGADEYAIKNFIEASNREPQNPVFLNEIGKMYIMRADAYQTQLQSADKAKQATARAQVPENLRTALEWLKKSVAAKPDYFPAHYHLGIVYERQNRIPEAIDELTQAHNANTSDSGIVFELAILYYRNHQTDIARQLLEQIVKAEPNQANARWYLAALYEEQGRLQDALNQMQELLKQMPTNATVVQKLDLLKQELKSKSGAQNLPLPEPLKEDVSNQTNTNPLKK